METVLPTSKLEMEKLIRHEKKYVRDAMLVAANNAAKAMET